LQEIDLFNNLYLLAEGDAGNAWIGQMTNLQKLFLGSTSFEYDGIPPYTANLPLLQELDFSFTLYTQGPIRDEAFLNNPLLTYVDIGNNEYTSTIPASITQHPSIQYLYIDNVIFDGVEQTLEFLVGMPSLIETWNDYTEFAASLPAALSSSSTLKSLSLTFCSLTGTLPPEWGSLSNTLDRLWLQQNLLTGTIPSAWENLVRLQYLYLQGNQLGGTVPLCTIRTDGLLTELGVDCDQDNPYLVNCSCCTCCGATECGDFL
jgi:Leucine-rich repeat (LRR) protein